MYTVYSHSHVHRHTPVIMHNFTLCHEQIHYNTKVLLGPFSSFNFNRVFDFIQFSSTQQLCSLAVEQQLAKTGSKPAFKATENLIRPCFFVGASISNSQHQYVGYVNPTTLEYFTCEGDRWLPSLVNGMIGSLGSLPPPRPSRKSRFSTPNSFKEYPRKPSLHNNKPNSHGIAILCGPISVGYALLLFL